MQANGSDPVEREMYMLEKEKGTIARAKTRKWEETGHKKKWRAGPLVGAEDTGNWMWW